MSVLRLLSRTKLYWGLIAIFLIGVLSSPVSSQGQQHLPVLRQPARRAAAGVDHRPDRHRHDRRHHHRRHRPFGRLADGDLLGRLRHAADRAGRHAGGRHGRADGWRSSRSCIGVARRRASSSRTSRRAAQAARSAATRSALDAFARPHPAGSRPAPSLAALLLWFLLPQVETKFGVLGRAARRALRRPAASARSTASSSSAGGCSPSSSRSP